jgi:hypothetical protein
VSVKVVSEIDGLVATRVVVGMGGEGGIVVVVVVAAVLVSVFILVLQFLMYVQSAVVVDTKRRSGAQLLIFPSPWS